MEKVDYEERLNDLRAALGMPSAAVSVPTSTATARQNEAPTSPNVPIKISSGTKTVSFSCPISNSVTHARNIELMTTTPLKNELKPVNENVIPSFLDRMLTIIPVIKTPIVLGIMTFLVIFGLLFATKPSFMGSEVVDEKGNLARKPNIKACFWFSAMAGALVLAVPYLLRWKNIQPHTQAMQPSLY
jgi:hypothetical protein